MILKCGPKDECRIFFIINEASKAYDGVIPDDYYHIPYMTIEELRQEMKAMTFYGYDIKDELIAAIKKVTDQPIPGEEETKPETKKKEEPSD